MVEYNTKCVASGIWKTEKQLVVGVHFVPISKMNSGNLDNNQQRYRSDPTCAAVRIQVPVIDL